MQYTLLKGVCKVPYERDNELLQLKRKAKLTYRDLANMVDNNSPCLINHKVNGIANWKEDERQVLKDSILSIIADKECDIQ